jgi:hypothetical protein
MRRFVTHQESARGLAHSKSWRAVETHTGLNSSSVITSNDSSRFACGHVILIHESSHPLIQRVGAILRARLEGFGLIQRLEIVDASIPANKQNLRPMLPEGARAPDLFLRLGLPQAKESGWVNRTLQATITASIGTAPWQSHQSTTDDTTPPVIGFHWNANLDVRSSIKGFETPKYRTVAESVANDLAKAITNELTKLSGKYGALPALPEFLYGPYQPAPKLHAADQVKAERAMSYFGLLTKNETFWRFRTATNPAPQLEAFAQALKEEQWKIESLELTNQFFIRARKEDARLEVFQPREAGLRLQMEPGERELPQFVVHYRLPFSRSEREGAFDRLLDESVPLDRLMLFERSYANAQRDRFYAQLEKAPARRPEAFLSLARMYRQRKDNDRATNALVRARALLVMLREPGDVESQLDAVAKEISPKKALPLQATADTYRELGFIEITNAAPSFSVEKPVGDPLLFFSVAPDGELRSGALVIGPARLSPKGSSYEWTVIQRQRHGRSTTSSSFDLAPQGSWQHSIAHEGYRLEVAVTSVSGNQLRYAVQVTGRAE